MVKYFRARAHSKCHVGALSKDSNVCCSNPCSIHGTVESAFAVNELAVLQDRCANLGRKIDAKYRRVRFSEQLLGAMSSTELQFDCLSRSIGAEIFILKCNKVNLM